jgi:uncharacterized lipoprotein YajG
MTNINGRNQEKEIDMCKKILVVLMVVALSLSACSALPNVLNITRGSGNVTSETREISGVTSVDSTGAADVDITFGEAESVVVEAEDNIVPLIETEVEGGRLVIGTKSNTSYSNKKPVTVHVTLKSLEVVSLSGSGSITVQNFLGDALKVDLSGSGDINVSGTADSADLTLGGSGKINGEQFKADSVKVSVDGSGDARVYVSEQLEADVSGSGSIRYSGNPKQVSKNVIGSGSITSE